MGVGVLAWVSARQSFPLSVENKGHGKKTPKVQSTKPHKTHAPLSLSPLWVVLKVAFACSAPPTPLSPLLSGSALPLPLRNRQPLELKHASPLNQNSCSACTLSTSQTILLHEHDASCHFSDLSAHFLMKPHTRCTVTFLATRLLVHHVSLWVTCDGPRSSDPSFSGCTGVHLPPTWPAESPEGSPTVTPQLS